jgi:hypothetical protein
MSPEFVHADDPEWLAENGYPVPGEEEQEGTEEDESAQVKVTVVTTMISENEMKLSAVVEDPEGRDFSFQWQVSEDGGNNYSDIAEANGEEFAVELNSENINNFWRVKVDFT